MKGHRSLHLLNNKSKQSIKNQRTDSQGRESVLGTREGHSSTHTHRQKVCMLFSPVMYLSVHQGAITAMSKAMAVDEARYNVRVNT